MQSDSSLANLFAAFAHPTRIAILRHLLGAAKSGRSFGTLSKELKVAPSTLTHHLRDMENAAVIHREVKGRSSILRLNLDVLDTVVKDLTALCCPPENPSSPQTKEPTP